jgi:hypothetical protein
MLTWCIVLFCLGLAAFLDSIFTYGEVFRRVNSILFMLISLGLLVRTAIKVRKGRNEHYLEKIEWLEKRLEDLQPEKNEAPASR